MEVSKRALINTLFVLGFTVYGVGFYIGAKESFSTGMIVSVLPFAAIGAIHLLDLAYRGHARGVVNRIYWVSLLCLLSMVSAHWIALYKGFPGYSVLNTALQSLMVLVPFHAALVVRVVNRGVPGFSLARMVLMGLSLLMAVNYLGYLAGFSNLVHSFEGRIALPFMRGLYDAAHLLSIINLMLLFHMREPLRRPVTFSVLSVFYLLNLAVMLSVNSRLSFLMFMLLTVLFLFRAAQARVLFPLSFFTLPLVLSFALLIYEVLTLPVFSTVLDRVSKADVTTFNGRSYLWYGAWEWLVDDRRGLLFGLGYNGQYWVGLLDMVAVQWGVGQPAFIHMHSSSLQVLLAQGLTGLVLMSICLWYAWSRSRRWYMEGHVSAPLFGMVMYLLLIWQLDIFLYGLDFGVLLLSTLLAHLGVDEPPAPAGPAPAAWTGRP
ncbi:MAG: O-antigen ligase family protein [Flavobacteriales bacterium]|nr:O-antigen ligase family protein [Flavobacteriales bacterium]